MHVHFGEAGGLGQGGQCPCNNCAMPGTNPPMTVPDAINHPPMGPYASPYEGADVFDRAAEGSVAKGTFAGLGIPHGGHHHHGGGGRRRFVGGGYGYGYGYGPDVYQVPYAEAKVTFNLIDGNGRVVAVVTGTPGQFAIAPVAPYTSVAAATAAAVTAVAVPLTSAPVAGFGGYRMDARKGNFAINDPFSNARIAPPAEKEDFDFMDDSMDVDQARLANGHTRIRKGGKFTINDPFSNARIAPPAEKEDFDFADDSLAVRPRTSLNDVFSDDLELF
jgi:hypothetical protein